MWRYRLCCCIRALIDIHKQTFHTIASVRPTSAVQVVWEGVTRVSSSMGGGGLWRSHNQSAALSVGWELKWRGGSIEPVCFSFSAAAFFAASLLLQMLGSTIIEGSVQPSCTRYLIEISCNISLQSVSISDLAPNTWSTHTEYISQNNSFFKIKIYTHMHAASWHQYLL